MKLVSLKVRNFRAYEGEHEIYFDRQFTSFIGKNDVGKSTVFDALDIFFGNKKPDLSDLCVSASEKVIEITCVFDDLPEEIEIDAGAKTKLNEEYLLNDEGNLEVKKVFRCTEKNIAGSSENYIVANYPSQSKVDFLHSLNQKQLKALGESKEVTVADARMNHLWRKGIWQNVGDLDLEVVSLKIDDFDIKAKKIYSKIEDLAPLLFVFKADREMTDGDSEAKDPMQMAVTQAQESYRSQIDAIKDKIQAEVEAVAQLALAKLQEIDPALASKLNPVLKSKPTWKFEYRIEDDRGVALNKRGSGTRRLVLLNFFRAQAEKKSTETGRGVIYAIEEPETSQHPDNQRLLIDALMGLAADPNRQVFITTHSPELLKEVSVAFPEGIRFIQIDEDGVREIEYGKDALILSASALGVLSPQEFGSAEKIILVEGKKDCLFLEHAARAMKDAGELTGDLQELTIEVLPIGGSGGVKNWIEMAKQKRLGLKTFVFLDSDRESSGAAATENEKYIAILNTGREVISAACTKKREPENYIKQSLTGSTFGDYDDAKNIISRAASISERQVIDVFWTQMTSADIDQEIKDFINLVVQA